MKKKQKNIQIALVSIGLLLILITYFYYPYLQKNKISNTPESQKDLLQDNEKNQDTSFENVQYTGIYDLDKTFVVNSEKAHILDTDPDVVYMTGMQVILYLNDGRIVNIVSNKGKYNKVTYDCFFEKNVEATDGETKIFSENMDLLATENAIKVYNNVSMKSPTGTLYADKIDYDFETKYFKISMFEDNSIKMKVIK